MTFLDFLLYLASGRLITWFLQTNGLTKPLWELHPKLRELSRCDLCLGFWVYLGLALSLPKKRYFGLWPASLEMPLLAALSSLMAHLLRLGWQSKFGGIEVIE